MEALINSQTEQRKPARYNLGSYLKANGLAPESPVYRHITDLAEIGGLYLVGGATRELINWKIKSLTPNDDSVSKFQANIGIQIANLEVDFEKALKVRGEILNLDFDLDLIVSNVSASYFMWKLLAKNETGFVTKLEKDPTRYSITPILGSSLNFKVDITDRYGNARLGKYATTLDSMILPVGTNLDLYGTSIYRDSPPVLGMLGDTFALGANFNDKMSQIIAVRFITQMLTVYVDKTGQEVRIPVYYGKDIQEVESTHKWLKNSLACVIRNRWDDPTTYHKFLCVVIPNRELFPPKIQEIIKIAFTQSEKMN